MNEVESEFWLRNLSAPICGVMRFTLVYHGPLSASGNAKSARKHGEILGIRKRFSEQLAVLWETDASLQALKHEAYVRPNTDSPGWDQGSVSGLTLGNRQATQAEYAEIIPMENLLEPISVVGKKYTPLVRKSLKLACELDIQFLRQENPGQLTSQGGDLDNRIKTLLDALQVPSKDEQKHQMPDVDHLYCLVERDSLICGLDIGTERLLFPKSDYPNEVFLIVDVSLRVLKVDRTNVCLL